MDKAIYGVHDPNPLTCVARPLATTDCNPPASISARGMCSRHYQAWKKGRLKLPFDPPRRVTPLIVGTRKGCPRCGEVKDLSDFPVDPKNLKIYPGTICKKCRVEVSAEWAKANPERARKSQREAGSRYVARRTDADRKRLAHRERLRKFNLTDEQFSALFTRQAGCCAICGVAEGEARSRRLSIDHDHSCCHGSNSCGKCVRGLLCGTCNTALGGFRDSPDLLAAAIQYLRSHSG